ncbi:MAG: methyltransferase [Clostridia bacterium]|nr:methyltransferase [Clostridia bacterium]
MDKVAVEIYVPSINETFDMFIPLRSPMYEVSELIKRAVSELSDGGFIATRDTAICYRESGEIININMSVFQLGIKNGSKLMLI